jgi:hypothetical protein
VGLQELWGRKLFPLIAASSIEQEDKIVTIGHFAKAKSDGTPLGGKKKAKQFKSVCAGIVDTWQPAFCVAAGRPVGTHAKPKRGPEIAHHELPRQGSAMHFVCRVYSTLECKHVLGHSTGRKSTIGSPVGHSTRRESTFASPAGYSPDWKPVIRRLAGHTLKRRGV